MTARWILMGYLGAGLAVAGWAMLLRRGGVAALPAVPSALLAGLLWPFVLPTMLDGGSGPEVRDPADRISALAARLRAEWARLPAPRPGGIEERRMERFVERLRADRQRLEEIGRALEEATPSVRARLERLRERAQSELDRGTSLLEELLAQLTVLRFANAGESAARREQVALEDLLAQIEGLLEASGAADGAAERGIARG